MELVPEEDEFLDEFYPELLGIMINFIEKYEHDLHNGVQEAIEKFGTIANQALFHISKESSLQFILEDVGWFASYRNADALAELFQSLQYELSQVYWIQIENCIPPEIISEANSANLLFDS